MKVDASLAKDIDQTKDGARAIEEAGYDGLWIGETKHDPFLQCLHAADATERVTVGTSIAIAFARTPMTVANSGYDLARYSKGRFVLGLGSQVKPHIERRFSMPWSHPAPRMREFVLALRAIWATWQDGTQARLPRRLLHAHADDAVLLTARARVRAAAGLRGRRRRADDGGRR